MPCRATVIRLAGDRVILHDPAPHRVSILAGSSA